MAVRISRTVSSRSSTACRTRPCVSGSELRRSTLWSCKPGGEQPLDDLIVQIPRDPVAIGEDVELPRRTVLLPQLQRERDLLRE